MPDQLLRQDLCPSYSASDRVWGYGFRAQGVSGESPLRWGIWGSNYYIPKAVFYLLKGDHHLNMQSLVWSCYYVQSVNGQGQLLR